MYTTLDMLQLDKSRLKALVFRKLAYSVVTLAISHFETSKKSCKKIGQKIKGRNSLYLNLLMLFYVPALKDVASLNVLCRDTTLDTSHFDMSLQKERKIVKKLQLLPASNVFQCTTRFLPALKEVD